MLFFQAEDGIRDLIVTGVQTCALPISLGRRGPGGVLRVRLTARACPGRGRRSACSLRRGRGDRARRPCGGGSEQPRAREKCRVPSWTASSNKNIEVSTFARAYYAVARR